MKLHRFLLQDIKLHDKEFFISDLDIIHQIKKVLRLQIGDRVIFLNGNGELFFSEIKQINGEQIFFEVYKKENHQLKKQKINLYFSVLKKDKVEWVLQKGTELGVDNFFPIISDRTEKNNFKKERALHIIKEAVEQSERIFMPEFHDVEKLSNVLIGLKSDETFYLDFDCQKINLAEVRQKNNINIFVGPEGGWSSKDKNIFNDFNIKSFSLGDFVLRAETASIAVLAVLKI
jgi:16S rRNA (uracil1498-N3)-methyltransferase